MFVSPPLPGAVPPPPSYISSESTPPPGCDPPSIGQIYQPSLRPTWISITSDSAAPTRLAQPTGKPAAENDVSLNSRRSQCSNLPRLASIKALWKRFGVKFASVGFLVNRYSHKKARVCSVWLCDIFVRMIQMRFSLANE